MTAKMFLMIGILYNLSLLTQGIPGALVNILKGFKGGKTNNSINLPEDLKLGFNDLDRIFSKNPFPDPLESNINNQEDVELDIGRLDLSIKFQKYTLQVTQWTGWARGPNG